MSSYFGIFKMQFKGELHYRAKAFSGVLTQVFFGLMYIYLFTAFMGRGGIEGFSIAQMASYIWLGQAFLMIRFINTPKRVCAQIENGDICYDFIRPMNLYNQWQASYIGTTLAATILRFWPILILGAVLPSGLGLSLPVSFPAFLLFMVALLLGLFINGALSMFAVYLTFITQSQRGSTAIVQTITGVLGGMVIPLPILPAAIQKVLNFMPFRYISDLAFRIYVGSTDLKNALIQIGIGLAWLVVLIVVGKMLIGRALKKTVIQGG